MTQAVDHAVLLPAYLAAGTALLALLADLALARRAVTVAVTGGGAAAVVAAVVAVAAGPGGESGRGTFCLLDAPAECSWRADPAAAVLAGLFGLLTLAVLGLSAGALRRLPAGEYCFLLACSMTGGVVLAYARDLVTLIVALETLTLPLYALVALRRRTTASAQGAAGMFVVSVVATAVTLLGAALLYSATGAVHFGLLGDTLVAGVPEPLRPVAVTGAALLVSGLAFKLAAVPFHAWAPPAYDGAPLPVAGYLSTASKLGGVVALVYVVAGPLRPWLDVVGPVLAGFAVLTMTVGNLVALRQRRMVRLLAWSSVAQSGYILAPLGAFAVASGRGDDAVTAAVGAAVAYVIFYVLIEVAAFGSVVALRGGGAEPGGDPPDGGEVDDYRGAARRAPLVGAAFGLALVGLAGLPPGLAGMFAKVAVVRSLVAGGAGWLAAVVALNVVVGFAYYLRLAATLYAAPAAVPPPTAAPAAAAPPAPAAAPAAAPASAAEPAAAGGPPAARAAVTASVAEPLAVGGPGRAARVPWPVAAVLGGATALAVLVGFAPQLVFDLAASVAP